MLVSLSKMVKFLKENISILRLKVQQLKILQKPPIYRVLEAYQQTLSKNKNKSKNIFFDEMEINQGFIWV